MSTLTPSILQTPAEQANADRLERALKRLEANGRDDPALRRSAPVPAVIASLQREGLAAIEVFAEACAAYGERPALGERAFTLEGTPEGEVPRFLPGWDTITYGTAWRRTVDLATGLVRGPRTALRPGELAGIVGFASIDYVIADLACLYAGVVAAVLQTTMDAADLKHIVNEGAFASLICAWEGLPGLLAILPDCPSVRSVVVMDLHPGATRETARLEAVRARTALPVLTLEEAAAEGRAAAPLAPWIPASGTDPLASLMYTSGSTGFPKGAMLPQNLWRSHWQLRSLAQLARFPSIGLNFYPLGHAMGRTAVLRTLVLGGVMHFTPKGDLSTLFEDIRLVRPTLLTLVPRVSEMIHQACRGERPGQAGAREGSDRAAFLGGRLTAAVIGSAPTAPEIVHWLASCFGIPVYEGYGSTEAGILSVDGVISRPTVSEYRLAAVPELGYRLDDRPHPRGELRVRTRQGIPGFFRNAEATRALYDADGFLRTGDIVEERGPDQVAWVDRINNVVKLAQGEYVTLWRLESLFSGDSPLLDQVYLHANSRRAFLLAVVVPDWGAVAERLGQAPPPAAVKQLLRGEFTRIAGAARLRPFEVPRDFLVEPARWTRENGLLTGVNKPARPQLKLRYGDRLDALYTGLDQLQQAAPETGATEALRLRKAIEAVLGVPDLDLASGSFRELGGDSVSALELSLRLEEICGRPVAAAEILNPGGTLESLVRSLEGRGRAAAGPSCASVHGRDGLIRAGDLRLERLLGPSGLAGAAAVAAQPLGPVRTVLLTGANGFLGHVLCLEWLERMAEAGGRVFALVRAPGAGAAAERLEAAFRTGDETLLRRFRSLAGGRLEVLAGDFAAEGLGLPEATYRCLAAEVDLIVHAGALVNHVFSYEQLFEPNVLGTARLLQFALEARRKRFDHVSTIGVLGGAADPGRVLERDGVDALGTVWPARGGYAHGYAATKWASEVLLKSAHERYATPVRVFRPDLIMPDRRYRGQANVQDMLTRLLASVVYTGLAPRSFGAGQGAPAHYDGLPVDFIAAAMAALSSAGGEGLATYQVSNVHWDDGVSLDTLIDWVATAGYPVRRMEDHDAWYRAFGAALQALPAERRQHSALPILAQWARPDPGSGIGRVDARRFSAEVRRLRPGGEAGIPGLTEAFLHKYLADLRALNLIGEPDQN